MLHNFKTFDLTETKSVQNVYNKKLIGHFLQDD